MRVECDVRYTEDPAKLSRMLEEFFPGARFTRKKDKIVGEADEKTFWQTIREQGTEPVFRRELEEAGFIALSKMAMLAGLASSDAGFPLGCVRVYGEQ